MMRTLLLDVDGTLLDSNDAHANAWVDALTEFGHDVPYARVRPLIGMGGDKLVAQVTGLSVDEGEGRKMTEWRGRHFIKQYAPTLRPFPQVRALLERARADGWRLVVATSAKEDEFEALQKVLGIGDLLHEHTTSDDAERSKPDPDIIEAALRAVGASPSEAIMLGDTPYDIAAAGRAGVAAMGVRCGGWDDAALLGAVAIYEDPAALLAAYDDSPLARDARVAQGDAR